MYHIGRRNLDIKTVLLWWNDNGICSINRYSNSTVELCLTIKFIIHKIMLHSVIKYYINKFLYFI